MTDQEKYHISKDEAEQLPNLLGLTDVKEIEDAESEGFLDAFGILVAELSSDTIFDMNYIFRIHRLALSELYPFAGELRTVNVSKGGFLFPSSQFLPEILQTFEREMLLPMPSTYESSTVLINDVSKIHAELLFIHPFREGNGRTARLLADLMVMKQQYLPLQFDRIMGEQLEEYIIAVQKASEEDYVPMQKIIGSIFSDVR